MIRIFAVLMVSILVFETIQAQEYWDFLYDGQLRSCIVYVPPRLAGVPGLPVVFNLPPYGWSYTTTRDRLKTHLLGDEAGFITVYPNPILIQTPLWGWQHVWNSGISDNPNYPAPSVDDVSFISFTIDSLFQRFSIDTTRIYACGYSNGGFMSIKLAGKLSHRIAAVASVAGVLSYSNKSSFAATRPVPFLLIHGTADSEVPFEGGTTGWYSVDETVDFFREGYRCWLPAETLAVADIDKTDRSTVEKYTYRSSSNSSLAVLFKVIGGDHTWPGALFPNFVVNRDIDANREIWNFVNQFTTLNPIGQVDIVGKTIPEQFALSQNYPNPFNPRTAISYQLSAFSRVNLRVYDLLGRVVAALVDEEKPAGFYRAEWHAAVSSGVYFYRLEAGAFAETRKMILLK